MTSRYKYENIVCVEARKDFKVYGLDDDSGEVYETTVMQGTKGVIESMGWSSTDGFRNHYDIAFIEEDGNQVDVSISENEMEELLIFL
jgi:hypothetical protein